MTDATDEFFDNLGRRGHEPALVRVHATVRFDIAQDDRTDHWSVRIDGGDIAVSREKGEAAAAIRADRELFNRILEGEVYIVSATLRNDVTAEGDPALIVLIQRLLHEPTRPRQATPVRTSNEP